MLHFETKPAYTPRALLDTAVRPGPAAVIALTDYERRTFFPGALGRRLELLLPDAVQIEDAATTAEGWTDLVKDVAPEVIVSCWCTRRLPVELPSLRYVCHVTGSVKHFLPRELMAAGVAVTNWGDVAGALVAEHTLLMVLGLLRAVPSWAAAVGGEWSQESRDRLDAKSLYGRRVSIHGFGQVARALLKHLAPFGVDVMAYSQGVPEAEFATHSVRQAKDMLELATWGDVFITCEALRRETAGTVSREVLMALPRGGVFVNVGRGAIVDETALADAALAHALRVGCDVFESEPLPGDSRLFDVPNALYSPHIAGPTPDIYPRCGAAAIANIERFLNGQALQDQVNLEMFDRAT